MSEEVKQEEETTNKQSRMKNLLNKLTPEHVKLEAQADGISLKAINKKTGKTIAYLNCEQWANASDGEWDDEIVKKAELVLPYIAPALTLIKKIF